MDKFPDLQRPGRASWRWLWLGAFIACVAWAEPPIPQGYQADRYQKIWEHNPFTLVTPVAAPVQPSAFDKLVLVSWMNNNGKDVLFVQNTETNDVTKVTTEPNRTGWKIVSLTPNQNPKLFNATISTGTEQGTVKFRPDLVTANQNPGGDLAAQGTNLNPQMIQNLMNVRNNPNLNAGTTAMPTPLPQFAPSQAGRSPAQGGSPGINPQEIRRRRTLPTPPGTPNWSQTDRQ